MKVGVMGQRGAFSDQVISNFQEKGDLPEKVERVYLYTTEGVLDAVHAGEVDMGVFAAFNSRCRFVEESVSVMGHYSYDYVAQHTLPIQHHVMVKPGTTWEQIRTIMGHKEAIRQCKGHLEVRCSDKEIQTGTGKLTDGGGIAEALVAGEIPDTVALLGSEAMARAFELEIVERDMADEVDNSTAFLLVKTLK